MSASSAQLNVDVEALLQNVIKNENLKNAKVKHQSGSQAGDGYIGINSAVEITSGDRILKLFVKAAPSDEKIRALGFIHDIFANEAFFYKTVYPEFVKFQTNRGNKFRLDIVPKCYDAPTENYREAIIMENLKENGYVIFDRKNVMNDEHISFVFKNFARFHAVSFAMKDQERDSYEKLTANLGDLMLETAKKIGMIDGLLTRCDVVKNMFADDKFISSKIQNITERLIDVFNNTDKNVDKYSIITQGDCWCNNMMFKYEDILNTSCPSDMKLIDWQIMRVNYPVHDLSYFFYTVCSKIELENLDHYLKIYHGSLSETIRELGSDPEVLYPYSIFLEHWRMYSKYGLLMAFMIIKVMLTENDEVQDFGKILEAGEDSQAVFNFKLTNEHVYKQRIRDLLEHFIRDEYL